MNDTTKPNYVTKQYGDETKKPAYVVEPDVPPMPRKAATTKGYFPVTSDRRNEGSEPFPQSTPKVVRVPSQIQKGDGFAKNAPITKGTNGNIAPANANDPTRRAQSTRTQWPDPMQSSQAGNDYIPVTSLAGWTAGATEAVMNAGITLSIRQGMLCIALTDVSRAMHVLSSTFGTPRT